MEFEFHPEALFEFREAANYYESCQSLLWQCFTDSIESGIQQICEEQQRWRPFEADVRRFLSHVFPDAILYSIESEYI